jgi:hypothetical protein
VKIRQSIEESKHIKKDIKKRINEC